MNARQFSDAMSELDGRYLTEVLDYQRKANRNRKRSLWTRWGTVAACLLLALTLSVPALAAADFDPAYELLYRMSPAIAQKLKPVRVSCADQGIEFEVVSAYVEGNEAEILVSVQDLEGDRIDETADLFDSYRIHTAFDCSSSCQRLGYDAETRTATFLISISQWDGQDITGEKITFSAGEILSGKQEYDDALPGWDADLIGTSPETVEPTGIFGGGGAGYPEVADGFRALRPMGVLCAPVDGVEITAVGVIDGKLHVQARYENVLETDPHGEVYFKNAKGEEIRCIAQVAFSVDEGHPERYEEYVFDVSEADLAGYELYGHFVTSGTRIAGHWSVTFPLERVRRSLES